MVVRSDFVLVSVKNHMKMHKNQWVQVMPYSPERSIGAIRRGQTMALEASPFNMCVEVATPNLYAVSQRNCRQAPDTSMTDMGRRSGCSSSNDDVESPALQGQGFQHVWRRCRAQSLCGLTTKLPPSTGYENDDHGTTFWQLVQQ